MAEKSDSPYVGGILGGGASKYNLQLVLRAFQNDYPITPDIRKLVVNQAAIILGTAKNKRTRLTAAKVLIAADGMNIKRLLVEVEDRRNDILESTAMLREAMKNPVARELLAKLSDQTCVQVTHEEKAKSERPNGQPDTGNGQLPK